MQIFEIRGRPPPPPPPSALYPLSLVRPELPSPASMMASPSSSPRWDSSWDNRNSGFVNPSQLQQWKQQQALAQQQREEQQRLLLQQHREEDTSSHPLAPPPLSPHQPQPSMFRTTSRPEHTAMSPAAPTHSRTTSAFSFFRRPAHHPTSSTTSIKDTLKPSPTTTLNEFGERQSAHTSSVAPHLSLGTLADKTPPPLPPGPSGQSSTSTDIIERPSSSAGPSGPPGSQAQDAPLPPLHPEIRSVVQLIHAHGQKIYYSGPLIRHIERLPDGQRPAKEDEWHNVWAQLGGTTLSLWDMKEIEEASKQGKQVPPSYINVTDAVSLNCRVVEDLYLRSSVHAAGAVPPSVRFCYGSCYKQLSREEVYERLDSQ